MAAGASQCRRRRRRPQRRLHLQRPHHLRRVRHRRREGGAARGLKAVAVTNGYIQGEARRTFYDVMDAANIDLKGFTEGFYEKVCLGGLEAVKDTLRCVKHETDCHLEVTTLLIPGHNDGDDELSALSRFVADELGVSAVVACPCASSPESTRQKSEWRCRFRVRFALRASTCI